MKITIEHPFLPEGVTISEEITTTGLDAGLARIKQAIIFIHDEADVNRTATPGERTLTARLDKFEKLIIAGLAAETKLEIANDSVRSPLR